jgi:hypothetical protein
VALTLNSSIPGLSRLMLIGRARPTDRSLTLQPTHALLQTLEIDVVSRIHVGTLGSRIGPPFAQRRPASRALRGFTKLQRAFGEVGEILPVLVS